MIFKNGKAVFRIDGACMIECSILPNLNGNKQLTLTAQSLAGKWVLFTAELPDGRDENCIKNKILDVISHALALQKDLTENDIRAIIET